MIVGTFSHGNFFIHTHCVGCFTAINYVFLHDLTREKSRHYVSANQICWFGVHLLIEKLFNQTHCVRYFTNIHLGCFTIKPVEKPDTMCWSYIYHTCECSCHDWCSIYWSIVHFLIKNSYSIWYHIMGRS